MGCDSSCGSCGTVAMGEVPKGCRSNGSCQTGSCNKLDVFDWLGDMELTQNQIFPIVEIRFKGSRKEFYRIPKNLEVVTGQAVIVDVQNGHHLGHVSLQGELVRLQMKKKKIAEDNQDIRQIYRIATSKDIRAFQEAQERETPTIYRARQIIENIGLKMKLSDVEYQSDGTKATFYYSADERVDFRELIKLLASEFHIRVEMRQISLREEAGRLGGIGSCGRELCCSTWLTSFKAVNTSAARYQNLALNTSKLSGQCGRLKCCLNYELQTYMDALNDIPKIEKPLETQKGKLILQKTDIFRKMMWFSYENENAWVSVPVSRVSEVIELNAKGTKPDFLVQEKINLQEDPVWQNDLSLEYDAISDDKKKRTRRRRSRNKNKKRVLDNKTTPTWSKQETSKDDLRRKSTKNKNSNQQKMSSIEPNSKQRTKSNQTKPKVNPKTNPTRKKVKNIPRKNTNQPNTRNINKKLNSNHKRKPPEQTP